MSTPKVAVIMGSDSDFPVVKKCLVMLKKFGIEAEVSVISAHRTPEMAAEYAKNAEKNGIEVIIAAAGKAAHLGGVLAAFTTLPVIGIPIKSSTMDGLDSLLSMVQMPKGIPVATVAINGGANAALLAAQIIAVEDKDLQAKIDSKRVSDAKKVLEKDLDIATKL